MSSDDKVDYLGWFDDENEEGSDYRVVCTESSSGRSELHVAVEGNTAAEIAADQSGASEDDFFGVSFKVIHSGRASDWVCLDEAAARELFRALSRAYADRERDGRAPSA